MRKADPQPLRDAKRWIIPDVVAVGRWQPPRAPECLQLISTLSVLTPHRSVSTGVTRPQLIQRGLKLVIFLDIDGVLHPLFPRKDRPAEESKPLAYLPRLAATLRDFPSSYVVISSTWRIQRSLAELQALFPRDLQSRIIGSTPIFFDSTRPGGREAEAMAWLDTHPEHTNWLAVDDCAVCWFSLGRLIYCDDGFRAVEESNLREALRES